MTIRLHWTASVVGFHQTIYCHSLAKLCLTLWPHGLQHFRLLCLPLFPRVCLNSGPLCQWCYLTISSSVAPFSFCLHSFPASGSFPDEEKSQLFTLAGQSIGASASLSVLPVNIQGYFPLGLTGLIPLQSKGLSRVCSNTTIWKHQFFGAQPSIWSSSHIWASLVAETVKRLPAMQETWVQSLGQEDPLEKEMTIHSSTLAWKIPRAEEPGRLQSMGSQRVGHDWVTSLHFSHICTWLQEKP